MLLHPNELRARREVLRTALKRLLDGFSGNRRWTRHELFDSPSAQSHQLNWQRNVIRVLMARDLISRIGPVKKPLYVVSDVTNSTQRLTMLIVDVQALEQLLRERFAYGNREPAVDDTNDHQFQTDSDSESETDVDPLQALLQLTYTMSESVIYIREAVDECRERLAYLEERLTPVEPSTEPADGPTPNLNGART